MALFSYRQQSSEIIFSFVLFLVFKGVSGATFTFVNKCDYTVWPGILSSQGQEFGNTGFKLTNGSSRSFQAPTKWSGRFWARTDCKFDDSGKGTCATGDCGSGGVTCNGAGATVPVTLVEFTLGSLSQDFYDVSLVDGFNVPITVEPKGGSGSCAITGCVADLNRWCPSELRADSGNGCKNPCSAFVKSEYCCIGPYSSPSTCKPSNYSQTFKSACPKSYSFPFDDATSTFTCSGANYTVTFCAASSPGSTRDSGAKGPQIPVVKHKANKWWIGLIIGMGAALALPLICYLCFASWRKYKAEVDRKMKQKNILHEIGGNAMLSMVYGKAKKSKKHGKSSNEVEIFSFESIMAASNNFSASNKLGEGGFGPVYKGTLIDGQEIAIKRLSKSSGQGLIEFKNEAKLIAKLHHTNLVRLLGFCIQRDERILVYEYMSNKSLDFYIFDASRRNALDWEKRFNIIEGIAQGLLYLHKYSRPKVIHRDLKASNILLDEEMNSKISDFGLARIFGMRGSEKNTNRIVGTYGYMSPEYAINGVVSIKIDVFSFGVLLLEILSGKKNNSHYNLEHPLNLIGYAWQLWNEGRALELIDSEISESNTQNKVLRSIHIGLLCVQDQANDRPSMLDVVSFLSNDTIQLAQPKQPAFFFSVIVEESELHDTRQELYSINGVTISAMDGR